MAELEYPEEIFVDEACDFPELDPGFIQDGVEAAWAEDRVSEKKITRAFIVENIVSVLVKVHNQSNNYG